MDSPPLIRLASPVTLNGLGIARSSRSRLLNGLLAALSLNPGGIVEFSQLEYALWGGSACPTRSNLRTLKSILDQQIRATGLDAQLRLTTHRSHGGAGGGYRLQVASNQVDVLLGQQHHAAAIAALPDRPEVALARCDRARELDLEQLGTDLPDTPWMNAKQTWAANLCRSVQELRCSALLLLGQPTRGYLDACAIHVPGQARARTWMLLIAGAYCCGDVDAALDHVRTCRGTYLDKGLHPPGDVVLLHKAILDSDDPTVHGLISRRTS